MNDRDGDYLRFRSLLRGHTLKEIPNGPEVKAYFVYRPGTTANAYSVVLFMGVVYLSSADHGAITLMPFEPDPLRWLDTHAFRLDTLEEVVPENLGYLVEEAERHPSASFFLAGIARFIELLRHRDSGADD